MLGEECEGGRVGWKQLGTLRLGTLRLGMLRLGVSSSTADVCSEGDGNMSGWWMWMVGDAGGSEEGEA